MPAGCSLIGAGISYADCTARFFLCPCLQQRRSMGQVGDLGFDAAALRPEVRESLARGFLLGDERAPDLVRTGKCAPGQGSSMRPTVLFQHGLEAACLFEGRKFPVLQASQRGGAPLKLAPRLQVEHAQYFGSLERHDAVPIRATSASLLSSRLTA